MKRTRIVIACIAGAASVAFTAAAGSVVLDTVGTETVDRSHHSAEVPTLAGTDGTIQDAISIHVQQ